MEINMRCFTRGRNTGIAGCAYKPDLIKGDIAVPYDWQMAVSPEDSDEDIVAKVLAELFPDVPDNGDPILTGLYADDYMNRMQFVGPYKSFDDKSEAPQEQSFSYGGKEPVTDGVARGEYLYDRGEAYHRSVRAALHKKQDQFKVVRVEGTTRLRFTRISDADGNIVAIAGMELDNIFVYPMKWGNGNTAAEFRIGWSFSSIDELNEDTFVVETGTKILDKLEKSGVIDVQVAALAAAGTGVFPLVMKTVTGSVNLADTLKDTLAEPDAFSFTNKSTGVAIDILTVVRNSAAGTYVVHFDTMSPGYGAAALAVGGMAAVSALANLDMEFYESNQVSITMN